MYPFSFTNQTTAWYGSLGMGGRIRLASDSDLIGKRLPNACRFAVMCFMHICIESLQNRRKPLHNIACTAPRVFILFFFDFLWRWTGTDLAWGVVLESLRRQPQSPHFGAGKDRKRWSLGLADVSRLCACGSVLLFVVQGTRTARLCRGEGRKTF